MTGNRKKVILLILDGWGYRASGVHNAIKISNPENFNRLMATDPHTLIGASGSYVGLPDGQMGNSEVGHTNIGAGRVVYQDLLRITRTFENGGAKKIPMLGSFLGGAKRLHLVGLMSDGGVHSHIEHFKGMIGLAKDSGIQEIYIHALTDGRDTPPNSGLGYIKELESFMASTNAGKIAAVYGRFYAMDRDKRWDRVQKAYEVMRGGGSTAETAQQAVQNSYDAEITDEFIVPVRINGVDGAIKDGDSIIFMNFRSDRMREIMSVFYNTVFDGFNRGPKPDVNIITMTEYDETMPAGAIFPSESLVNILSEVVSKAGLKQLRIAETEKYAHVTFFFNGGREEPFDGEERILVPSPREVATYDLKPEMSVSEVDRRFEERFKKGDLDLVIMNFANPDMVGHTGVEEAAVKACKAVDEMLGKVVKVADEMGAVLIVTADHGNSEEMWDEVHNQPHTAHTTNPVPLIIHNYPCTIVVKDGKLADIAPTILKIMGIDVPQEMSGDILIAQAGT